MTNPQYFERCFEAENNLRILFPRAAFYATWSLDHITTLCVTAMGPEESVDLVATRIREVTGHQPRVQREAGVARAFFTLSQFHREELFRKD